MPRISIIIPLYNVSEKRLRLCLENVTGAFESDEIILSDNSDDYSAAEVVEEFRRTHRPSAAGVRYYHHAALIDEKHRSRAQALNFGARISSGDILLFLHSDVRVPPDARERIVESLGEKNVVAGGFLKRYNIEPMPPLLSLAEALLNARARILKLMVGTNAIFVWRKIFLSRPFEDTFLEDFEYADWLRGQFGSDRIAVVRSSAVRVSAERYEASGVMCRLLINTVVMAAYRLRRLPANQLESFYSQAGKLPLARLMTQSAALLLGPKAKRKIPTAVPRRSAAIVFVKSPEAGKVKTRFFRETSAAGAPRVTAEEACEIYQAFLDDLFARLETEQSASVEFFVSPSFQEAGAFRESLGAKLPCYPKTFREDLGTSMKETVCHFLACGYPAAMILNSDAPHMELGLIERAARTLKSADVVLGPDHRGGCYLIGFSHPRATEILNGVTWSAGEDFDILRERARVSGWRVGVLPVQYDIDEIEDLERLAADLSAGRIDRSILKRTAAVLDSIVLEKAATQ